MNTIFTIGIFLSLFLAFLLFTKRNKTLSDTVLSIWMLFISIHLLSYNLYYLGYWKVYPHLVGLTHPFPLLHGPFLYLYVVFSLRSDQKFRWKDMLHFLPFVIDYLGMFPFIFGYTAQQKLLMDSQDINSEYQWFFIISLVSFVISGITYPVLSYRKITNYQQLINENFAYEEGISLRWLKVFIMGLGIIFLVGTIIILMREVFQIDFGFNSDLIIFVLIVLLVFLIGFSGIRYQGIFTEKAIKEHSIVEVKTVSEYRKSGLKSDEVTQLHQEMLSLMKEKKPYLEPKLTLSQLAEQLAISSNNLSQVINQCEGKNFYDFVNSYRVDEFIKRATNDKNRGLNLLGIALDSGFNSKSSFNQVFKKHTGDTPSNYLKNNI
ncbi:AraC family transcriptional regulator [Capnocytophaga stomatis]|uniref:AraC family transcriptional regulator n=1 Tax=Capnocytophaga stomatis TaxID=1848904 RepID=A0A250FVV6_9FLAO|nr:helix-turn-helix domain-containing protein [Capnocytophaga stomatis]ATA88575.1 AraC family transcriptional regulator [Capnocytophaga stomatis]